MGLLIKANQKSRTKDLGLRGSVMLGKVLDTPQRLSEDSTSF